MSLIVGLLVSVAPLPAAASSSTAATAVGAVAQSLSGPQAQSMLAKLAAGNPGVPSAPTTLFQENFENVPGTAPVLLSAYTGTTGQQYAASAPWLQNCNGLIVNFNVSNTLLGNCATTASASSIRQLSYALGVHAGSATPGANDAVSALTESPGPGANLIEFATLTPVPVSGANGRFLTFSLDAATRSCATSAPLYTLSYVSTGGTVTPLGSQINPCASGTGVAVPANGSLGATTLNVGTYTANGSFLSNGTAVGIRLVNANGASAGNDAAIDNVRILDVTPQLDKSFAVSARLVGQPTTLTFTITNTSELAAKSGWGFVDTLPAGMTVAPTPNLGGTCTATRTAAAGSGTITVSGGSLAANQTSCTITVDVVSTQVGSYTNGPTNVTTTGLNAPGSTTVQYTNPVEWTCSPDGYLFQSIGTTTAIFAVDLVTGAYAQTGTISRPSNAQGYNTTDDYVYAVIQQRVHRVGSDGSTNDVTPATGWVPGLYNIGDFDEAGHYWVSRNVAGSPWFEIDYAAGSPTYGQVISSGTLSPASISVGSDWVYVDGSLYSINDQGRLIVFDTATKLLTDRGPVAGVPGSVTGSPANYGAGYADADGNLYFSRNETGVIYRVDPDALTSVPFTDGPASTGNDGARCATVPVEIDLGDAPDSYGTTIGADGARHSLSAVDAGGEVTLRLGSAIDAELEGQPTAAADGDDLAGIADEDGVASPIVMASGSTTAVTVSVTNDTGAVATLAGWIDLNGNGVFDAAELVRVVVPAHSGTADYTLTFPVGTATADTFARFRLFEGDVAAPSPVGPAAGGEVEDYPVAYTDRSLSVEKTSSQTADSRPGDVVTYTVTATNTGASPYDAQVPAVIFDDIRAVLDDAEYNGDATATTGPSPVYLDPGFLSWRGSLAPGASVTIEYSVTLTASGDGVVRNVAWQPATPPEPGDPPTEVPTCDPATADGVDPVTGEPCAATTNLLPRLTVEKTADTADLPVDGGAVTYTIVVTNVGPGAFTGSAPATLTDDLSEVLDDADYNGDAAASVGSVTVASSQLNWSGALASGQSATITYSVTYDASAGDNVLLNTACVPEDDALDPDEACNYVQIPGAALVMTKTVDPADGSVLVAGQQVTYTLSFENIGQSAATVDALDTLTGVLDDAQITAGPTASAGLTATLAGDELSITGSVPVGQTLTVTYTATVDAFADQGDHVLGNVLSNGDGSCPPAGCEETENPVRHYTVEKEAATTAPTNPGDTVTYTVTVTNDGAAPYTSTTPASISDDLAAVLDDATLTGTPTAVVVGQPGIQLPAPVFSTPTLTWSGAVGVGQTVEITYTVQVNAPRTGDGSLENAVTPTGLGGECEVDGCATITPVQWFTVSKSASATSALPGDTLVYSVVVTNDSAVPYTVGSPASFTDDLSGVLDDATYNGDATNGATVTGSTLSWQGALAPGASVVIVYSVTIDAPPAGDAVLANVVVPTGEGGECVPDECATATPVQSYTVAKTVSATTAVPGDVLTYTVTVTNTGAVDYTADAPASFTDDLSAVLDDATYNNDATNGATVTGSTLTWSGTLAVGASVDITYSVTVDDPSDGDDVLTNVVVATGDGGDCEPDACTTTTELRSYTVSKAASATTAQLGDTVVYTVTVTNTGAIDYTVADPASFTDDLSAVLDDATYNDDATNGATVTGSTLTWSGALAAGDAIDITYSVTVTSPVTGDDVLTNAVVPTSDGGDCVPDECATRTPVQSFAVTKTADATDVIPGDTITYTLTIVNTGQAPYTAASPATLTDDLSDVLDDATYNDDATNGATYAAPQLTWSGALAVGETVTVTYSVTVDDPVTGDSRLVNGVVTDNGGNCEPGSNDPACVVNIPTGSFTVQKQASAAEALPGDVVTYTVTVTNTGAIDYTVAEPASFADDLTAVLDDATYNDDATNGATVSGTTLTWAGPLAAGASIDIVYSVTVDDPTAGDSVLANAVAPTSPGGECVPGECATLTPVSSYTVAKSASTATAAPGDVVTYTVTVTNTGAVAYTADSPASFADDLSAVLDDATYNGDATNGATVTGATLAWSGALAVGASIDITYSVTVNDPPSGDDQLTNTVIATGDGGGCVPEECTTSTQVRAYSVSKTASTTTALPGDTVTYTVTVTNTGAVDYTADAPASFSDDFSGVLDDATYNGDASSGAVVTGSTLDWSGALEVGESVEITYSVTVDDPGAGDDVLANVVVPTGEGGECVPDECATATPVQSYTVAKTVSATTAVPGDVLTYTVTVTNTGAVDYTADAPASFTDDLSAVLDDATYNNDATNGATVTGSTLTWSGTLVVGASVDITYSVTVDDPSDGDDVLTNVVVPTGDGGDCEPDACTTTTELRSYTVSKTASVATAAPGDVVSYTVTVQNTGAVDYTAADPASFTDDLSAVLDDATYNDDATNGATVTGSTLTWSGALAAGETVEIIYSVTVNDPPAGDDVLTNAVVPTGDGGACGDDCATTTEVRSYTVAKSASTAVAEPGSVVSYTVTVTNTGAVDYTVDDPASFSDDLSAVLDDATYNDDASNGATVSGTTLSWDGPLAAGASIEITYSVTVDDPSAGDDVLTNAVTPTGDGGDCVPDACVTATRVQSYTVSKVASTATALPGTTVGYTVTVTNTGSVDYTAAAPASFTDDLSAVLDDATYNGDATNGATVTGTTLTWSGPLAAGASVDVTYSVTVNDPASGDDELVNTVVATGPGGDCDPLGSCSTTTDVQSYTVSKTASAPSVQLGGTLVYTVTVTNTGGVDYTADAPASFTDDLSAVLDDATYNGDATNGATVTGSTLAWAGALAAGASIDITYSVTVNAPNTGDDVLANAVVPSGPGGSCAIDGDCETLTPVQSFSVTKTADASTVVAGDTITYTLTIVNTGAAAYTADSPATLTDDLTDVLDDATYNDDATNGAIYAAPQLSWTGALAVGETVTVTYSVTVDDPITGDRRIDNAVVTDNGGTCDAGSTDPACVVNIPAGSFTVAKTASATSALSGDVVTYTVTVRNTGAVPYTDDAPASFEDNLANVLDDATYNDDATNGATVTGTTLAWQGALAVDETIVITYSVTVDDAGSGVGDANLGNVVVASSPGGECDPEGACATDTPIGRFLVTKTSDGAGVVHEGDVLTYTITVTNDGDVAFTQSDPASFTDDLSDVLDDATYNGDATAGATIDGTTLSWQGPLAVGATVTLTYSVTLGTAGDGDGVLTNGVVPGDGGACILSCSTTDELQAYTVSKTSSAGGSVGEGDVVTYTVTVTNTGAVDYTEDSPATFTDDLSAVLDDAAYNDDASAGATVSGTTLSWSGAVPSGSSIEITYSVTALAAGTGDGVLTNVVVPIGPGGECAPDDDCSTTDLLRAFRVDKATSATSAERGDVVVYTVTVTNTGAAAFTADAPARVSDDLSGVLDDASYNGDASNGATYAAPVLSWSLALARGESVALTYSVTVDDSLDGDLALVNAVDPGADGACAEEGACVTETPVGGFSVAKAVDVATTGPGATVTYAITVRNEGAVAYTAENPAVFADDLSDVLDDGTYNGDATNGATYDEPVLVWSGPLGVGESITVTYSVTVDDQLTGDRRLENAVLPGPGGGCAAQCSVTTSVVTPGSSWLATTGLPAGLLGGALGAAGLAVLAGLVLLARRPRHEGVHHDV